MRPDGEVPPRPEWPEPKSETAAGEAFTAVILATFQLNGLLMEAAERLASAGGITASWWQVLGGILDQPRSLAEIGRRMGMTRQGVRRVADILIQRGLAEYRTNPAHRRAHLLACTEAGYWAVRQISLQQHPWAAGIGAQLELADLQQALGTMHSLIEVLSPETLHDDGHRASG